MEKPPDVLMYKCHRTQPLKTYVCLLCGEGYHVGCFPKQAVYLQGALVICDKHMNDEVNEDSPVSTGEQTTLEILKKQIVKMRIDLEQLRQQNKTLMELNSVMKQNNQLLNEKIIQKNYNENLSYAQVAGNNGNQISTPKTTYKNEKTPSILISSQNLSQENMAQIIKSKLNPTEAEIGIKQFKLTENKKMIKMACRNEEENKKLEKLLIEKLPPEIKVSKEILEDPSIKIVNLETEHTKESLKEALTRQNNLDSETAKIVVKHVTEKRNKQGTFTAYLQLDPKSFRTIMSQSKVLIGWESCKVYEDLNLDRCFNCNGYFHNSKKCRNEKSCSKCSEHDHSANRCKNPSFKCLNCARANEKYSKNYPTNHRPDDVLNCNYYKAQIERMRSKINYNG